MRIFLLSYNHKIFDDVWGKRLSLFFALSLFIAIGMSPLALAERAVWAFDTDPGLLERHDGSDSNFQWNVSGGTLTITTTREAAVQRVYFPLAGSYGNESTFRIRMRFRVASASYAACVAGFFRASDSSNLNAGDTHIGPDFEDVTNYPRVYSGCGLDRPDPGPSVDVGTWYIMEYDYEPFASDWGATLFDDNGTPIETLRRPTCGTTPADVFAFANEDRSQAGAAITLVFDWVSWSVNEPLLPDPIPSDPFEPLYAPIPQPDDQVVALWLLDETNGPAGEENWGIYDQSGHGNHGFRAPISAINNAGDTGEPDYTSDVPNVAAWNSSLNFGTGASAHVEIPDSATLDLTGDFTVEIWVSLNTLTGVNQYLVSKRNAPGGTGGYILEWTGGSKLFYFTVGTSAGYQSVASQSFTPTIGQWVHLAGVHDASAGEIRLYINGQLNNSNTAEAVVNTNNDPLWLGNWVGGGKPADAKLDEVRLSNRIVPSGELGFFNVFGPERIIFGDEFESYSSYNEMLSRSGGQRNHWNVTHSGAGSGNLVNTYSYTPSHSTFLQYLNAAPAVNHELTLYYNLPVAHTRQEPLISQSGWVSFTGEENVRLIFECQMWPGFDTTYYGLTNELCAGSIEYWGDTKTWRYEPLNGGTVTFTNPITYGGDLNTWHYYKVILDFSTYEYVSFQFDNDIWDLSGNLMRRTPYGYDGLLPTIDFECRLYELASEPTQSYTAQWCVDNAVLAVEKCLESTDFNQDCSVDYQDHSYLAAHWDESGKSVFDLNSNQVVDLADLFEFVNQWLLQY